ncbi:unnamed protein product [Malus baccata var. baccata]|uniref:60S acidic ribosomal protein P1 n=1 Tax=Malus domestica TaxID=3750 RepID=A0A498KPJ5_MALDO|nr:hypothetical protein DVH24_005398 [Malus domestica]
MAFSELACSYAALILHDDGIPITSEKIATLVKAANITVESYWPGLFAKLAEKKNIDDLILNVGAGGGGAAVAVAAPGGGAAAPAAAAPAAEEKKVLGHLYHFSSNEFVEIVVVLRRWVIRFAHFGFGLDFTGRTQGRER